jgi:Ca2+-transporting ATPase
VETLLSKHWHAIDTTDVQRFLETDTAKGLDRFEVQRRQGHFGPNLITAQKKKSPFVLFLQQFNQALVYILIAAGAITFILQEYIEALFIFGVVLVNALIGFIQEYKALAAIDALVHTLVTEATIIRSDRQERIDAAELVPGDVVILQSGDKVPADMRLFEYHTLRIDESALTGESVPVFKQSAPLTPDMVLADRTNMAYASTLVTFGRGAGIVVATGDKTEVGRISKLMTSAVEMQTPLTKKIAQFSHYLIFVIFALAAVTFGVGLLRGEPLFDMFLAAVALAVGTIPEGMPAAITIMLALGVSRMASRRAIIRKLPAVETLGSTTVICSDKTGTLTQNEMTVLAIHTVDGGYTLTGTGYGPEGAIQPIADSGSNDSIALNACLTSGVLCNDSRVVNKNGQWQIEGDPTEGALVVAATKAGIDAENLRQTHPRSDEIPFDSKHQFMATLNTAQADSARRIFLKGATEVLLERCATALDSNGNEVALDHGAMQAAATKLASRGLRVLTMAQTPILRDDQDINLANRPDGLVFLGFQAMMDPPRPSSADAVQTCRRAGIGVKMITGDHALTAEAIAHKIGMMDNAGTESPSVITGTEIAGLDDEGLVEAAESTTVFARVTPEQKLRLVEALQDRSHVVAMTGDGVNDAPALRKANIGVAMGQNGTEVAKEAADMVLLDDNFSTIVAAVEEGRSVFDNLIKFIVWTLPTNLGEGLVILAAILVGVTLPILPIQILWINMSTAVLLGLMLAFEPREAGIMQRAPREPKLPMLTSEMVFRIFFVGFLMLVGGFGLFEVAELKGYAVERCRTIAVNVFIFVEIFYLFNSRSLQHSVFRIGFFTNPWAFAGVAAMVGLQMLFTYHPIANRIFQSAPISVVDWVFILTYAILVYCFVEIEKAFRRRRQTVKKQT